MDCYLHVFVETKMNRSLKGMINNFIRCYWLQAAARGVRSPITADRITDWLVDNKVLSIALGGMYSTYTYTCMCSVVLCFAACCTQVGNGLWENWVLHNVWYLKGKQYKGLVQFQCWTICGTVHHSLDYFLLK